MAVMTTVVCAQCGMEFGVPEHWDNMKRKNGENFYCPNGHTLTYGNSDLERLKADLQHEKARRVAAEDQAEAAERSKSAIKGQLTKAKNKLERAEKGVCPHCKRYFVDLHRHMGSKHPEGS